MTRGCALAGIPFELDDFVHRSRTIHIVHVDGQNRFGGAVWQGVAERLREAFMAGWAYRSAHFFARRRRQAYLQIRIDRAKSLASEQAAQDAVTTNVRHGRRIIDGDVANPGFRTEHLDHDCIERTAGRVPVMVGAHVRPHFGMPADHMLSGVALAGIGLPSSRGGPIIHTARATTRIIPQCLRGCRYCTGERSHADHEEQNALRVHWPAFV